MRPVKGRRCTRHVISSYRCRAELDRMADEARRRVARAARRLGIRDPEDAYYVQRPKGMHAKTFDRLSLELYICQAEERDALRALTARLNERLTH